MNTLVYELEKICAYLKYGFLYPEDEKKYIFTFVNERLREVPRKPCHFRMALTPCVAAFHDISMKIRPIQKTISNTLRKLIPVQRPMRPPLKFQLF